MGRRLHLGTYAGIPVYVHWTFGFVFLMIIYVAVTEGLSISSSLWLLASMLSLFLFVILHEYGHALAARRYKVITRDIIISPIGGVARMEEMPDKPWKELVIAIAGPLVNVVVAVILGFVFYGLYSQSFIATDLENFALTPENLQSFIRFMIVVNITLFLFNLIPAFPMDGGRILRALLSMVTTRVRATFIASVIGRILAVAFIALAVWLPHVTIGFIGVFIFFMATNENKQAVLKDKLSNTSLSEIMEKDYPLIFHHETMQKVLNFYNQGVARNFLVFDDNQNPIGSIPEVYIRDFIKRELSSDQLISKLMSSAFGYFTPEDRLEEVFETMNQNGWSIAGIKNGDRLVAVVDRHIINSFINRKA